MKHQIYLIFFLFLNTLIGDCITVAQPVVQWQQALGGTRDDVANCIKQTTDGGYIVAGYSFSNDTDVSGHHGSPDSSDCWVAKLNNVGAIEWQKSLGGNGDDIAWFIQQTTDGGYIMAGESFSNDGDASGNHGGMDAWVVKLDSGGGIKWQKSFGGSEDDFGDAVQQTKDGGYIVAGASYSNNGDVSGHHGASTDADYWVFKLDSSGTIKWQKSLGGTSEDDAYSIEQTTDSGYIVAGITYSNDSDVSNSHGIYDSWVVKLDSTGTIKWEKALGGSNGDASYSVQQTVDGGFIAAGITNSTDGNVSGIHGADDFWVTKLDSSGTIKWQSCLGGSSIDGANSIRQTTDGGYVVTGLTISNDGEVSGNHGSFDYWVVKINGSGVYQWQKCLGGTGNDAPNSIIQTADGGFIVAGSSTSANGDVTNHYGSSNSKDFWVVKLSTAVDIDASSHEDLHSLSIYPNPARESIAISHWSLVNGSIAIYNMLGELVYCGQTSNTNLITVNCKDFPAGVYVVRVGNEERNYVAKVIIQ